uniref:Leucine rich repeat containing 31 n=1 Tax=Neogobius melanostomus TaxID=47308 RepID=A0A8C6WN51_9GOBI
MEPSGTTTAGTGGQRPRDSGSVRRSPLDLIINQIRRKRSDRRPLGRLLSWASDRTAIRESAETEERIQSPEVGDGEHDIGWGRIRAFLHKLGKDTEKGKINLSHCDLTATDLLELGTLLPYVPQLEQLDLSWNELIGGSLRALTSHLNHMNWISALKLNGCRLDHQDIAALGEALSCLPSVEVLDLSWNGALGGGALQGLVGKLQPSLTELHLVACELTAADGTLLGGILSPLSRLCVLDVSCNPHFTDGVKELSSALSKAASLKTLRLQRVGLSPHSLQALGDSLQSVPSLRHLDLSCNRGLSGHLPLLTPHLTHLSLLETLDLSLTSATNPTPHSVLNLTRLLKDVTNEETMENIERLSGVFPLHVYQCEVFIMYFSVLAVPYLRCVDLSWCKVVGARLSLLLDALQPSVLQELRLSSCELTTDDVQHLASACHGGFLSSLRILDLSYNSPVGANGWSGLLTSGSQGGLGSLEELDLSLRPVASAPCSEWLPALFRALPRLTALKRLGLQRWTIEAKEKLQLDHCLKKRNVLLEMDAEERKESVNEDKTMPPEE